jgi:lysozyme family protein
MCNQNKILADGLYGTRTEKAINEAEPDLYLEELVVLLIQYYFAIVKHNLTQKRFLNGWLNRAKKLPKA